MKTRSQLLFTLTSTYHYKVSYHSLKGKVIACNIFKSKFSLANINLSRLYIRRQSHGGQKPPLKEYKLFHLKRGVDVQKWRAFPFRYHRHVVCLTTGQCQRILGTVQSSASTFSFQYHHVALWTFTSYVSLLPLLLFLSLFPSITCVRRKVQRKMWLIQLPSCILIYVGRSFPPRLYVILSFRHTDPNVYKTINSPMSQLPAN
jgi:hypothetical protein